MLASTALRSALTASLLLALGPGCPGDTSSCEVSGTCPDGSGGEEAFAVDCDEGECSCTFNGVQVGTCDLDDLICDAIQESLEVTHLDRNQANAAFVPLVNDCCELSHDAKVWDFSGDDPVVVTDGCDVTSHGGSFE